MAPRADKLTFHVVSPSRDLALRQLRSYAASFNAGIQVHRQADALLELPSLAGIVVIDDHDNIDPSYLDRVKELPVNIFVHDEKTASVISSEKEERIALFSVQARCTINEFFESQMIRAHLAQVLASQKSLTLSRHLPWGCAERTFKVPETSFFEMKNSLVSDYGLDKPCRAMIDAFFERLGQLSKNDVAVQDIAFFCDGIQVLLVCCAKTSSSEGFKQVDTQLRGLKVGQVILNRLSSASLEVGFALPLTEEFATVNSLRSTIIFNQTKERSDRDQTPPVDLDLVKAG